MSEQIDEKEKSPVAQLEGAEKSAESIEAPKKRGRGRPPKTPDILVEEVTEGSEAPKPKRTYTPRKTAKGKTADIADLGKQLVGIHAMAAMVTGFNELQLGDDEGEALAKGILDICEQYNLSIDGKTGASLQLLAAAAMIYGPRALMIRHRLLQAKAAQSEMTV